jgi:hypothetical protein
MSSPKYTLTYDALPPKNAREIPGAVGEMGHPQLLMSEQGVRLSSVQFGRRVWYRRID